MELRGRVALVTGGAKRVGQAIALALGTEGMRVAVHHNTARSEAEETARLIGDAQVFQADLAQAGAADRLVQSVLDSMGSLAVLVNSASIFAATPWPPSDADWERHLEINLTVPMRLIRAATEALRRERGVAVNIIDAMWTRPTWPHHSAYCVSKAALAALTQNLARTLAPEIRVLGVAPGAVLPPEDSSEADRAAAVRRVPLGRWGAPGDVANAVLSLLRNDYITGEILCVDGGRCTC